MIFITFISLEIAVLYFSALDDIANKSAWILGFIQVAVADDAIHYFTVLVIAGYPAATIQFAVEINFICMTVDNDSLILVR